VTAGIPAFEFALLCAASRAIAPIEAPAVTDGIPAPPPGHVPLADPQPGHIGLYYVADRWRVALVLTSSPSGLRLAYLTPPPGGRAWHAGLRLPDDPLTCEAAPDALLMPVRVVQATPPRVDD
jgi:hypothetical protein